MALVFPPKLLAILLKDAFDRCFLWPQVTPRPARTYAACVSLSLSTMSISSGDHSPNSLTRGAKTPRTPSQAVQQSRQLVGFSSQSGPPRRSAASLSDPAYMATPPKLSTPTSKDFQISDKYPSSKGNIRPYWSLFEPREVPFLSGNSSGQSKNAASHPTEPSPPLLLDACSCSL